MFGEGFYAREELCARLERLFHGHVSVYEQTRCGVYKLGRTRAVCFRFNISGSDKDMDVCFVNVSGRVLISKTCFGLRAQAPRAEAARLWRYYAGDAFVWRMQG